MQVVCQSAIPQFHLVVSTITFATLFINQIQQPLILLGVLQYITSNLLLFAIVMRYKYTMRKSHILILAIFQLSLTIILLTLKFGVELLLINIIQLLSTSLQITLLYMKRQFLAIGILVQIYIIASLLDCLSLYLWFSANEFQLNRAIAIVGSGGVGLITLLLCLLCQLKPQRSLTKELHIIVGFYIFCELFICCMIIVECVNCQISYFLIALTLMKISNIFLDVLLYPFANLQQPQKSQICKIQAIEIHTLKTESPGCKEQLDSEIQSQTQIEKLPKSTPVIVSSTLWINQLLEIY